MNKIKRINWRKIILSLSEITFNYQVFIVLHVSTFCRQDKSYHTFLCLAKDIIFPSSPMWLFFDSIHVDLICSQSVWIWPFTLFSASSPFSRTDYCEPLWIPPTSSSVPWSVYLLFLSPVGYPCQYSELKGQKVKG